MTHPNEPKVFQYVKRIRNAAKRQYAYSYALYALRYKAELPAPDGLTSMGAQAVRLAIKDILAATA